MLTTTVFHDCEDSLENQRQKNKFREFLYIPEVQDKKYRLVLVKFTNSFFNYSDFK